MRRVGFLFLAAICAFMLLTVRTGERLACSADPPGQVTCDRIQHRLSFATTSHFRIPDPSTFAFHAGGGGGSNASVRSAAIQARDSAGRRVVVLNVPERDVAYASDLEKRLRNLPSASPPTLVFERDERRTVGLLAAVIVAFWIGILTIRALPLFRRANGRQRFS